ncbi:RNA-binding protein Rrp4 (containing S1 domain and KH domain) [Caldisphaera lagunensis DSM 15908]|uniref:Exosome complex component Rrp4 n=1 Tax=Caldisphaera lagunensis (strain DSM 15908 / JCM 11604 / ANMR 0165 / IC-154) TaxID=1056495 RepID=L0AAR0_CALLD|nr:exosome complex RNA-binding protein Rrp4 [Caldisphaera lagunensis]AFZ70202.1 RNA-binding protein Rrp4 (containing S1 domain and KH domain) [Caldisphaera lagunensis DSM 15908]
MSAIRKVLVPGEKIEGTINISDYYIYDYKNEKRVAIIGVVDYKQEGISYSPLNGIYIPKEGDIVIGLVTSHGVANWFVDINSPYQAILSVQDFFGTKQSSQFPEDPFKYLQVGEYIKAKIAAFDRIRNPLLTVQDKGLGKIAEGIVVSVHPTRVPRIIGKKGSMIEMLKNETGCEFFVAVNGMINIKCQNEQLESIASNAIKIIETQAHISGLTERVKKFIEEERKIRGV